jgi:catechol 2,3-dioxygenase-like lactoylglutathione lyase family enzyme
MTEAYFIIYVADQQRSANFYTKVLSLTPTLDVPGMTEFTLNTGAKLGIMPETGIKRLLGDSLPAIAAGIRAELYLLVDDAAAYHTRALSCGAVELSQIEERDWGHSVAYSADPDGYVLAFAQPSSN